MAAHEDAQIAEIGLRQLELGAGGLTVAKTGEAQVFQEARAPALCVHYPPFGADKWERLADVAAKGVALTVAVDSVAPPKVSPPNSTAVACARNSSSNSMSVCTEPGARQPPQRSRWRNSSRAFLRSRWQASAAIRGSAARGPGTAGKAGCRRQLSPRDPRCVCGPGFRTDRISGGSTPTRYLTHTTCVNEFRSGTYVFLDRNDGEVAECALWVEVTVISDAVQGQIIVDAGSKTFTEDGHPDGGYGAVKGWSAIDFAQINEEHGYLDISSLDERPAVGQHLQIIPNHACGCVNLHDGLLAVRDGVVDHVIVVAARGLVR